MKTLGIMPHTIPECRALASKAPVNRPSGQNQGWMLPNSGPRSCTGRALLQFNLQQHRSSLQKVRPVLRAF